MKNYMIPGLYEHYQMNIIFLEFYKYHPEFFNDNINMRAIYGNFQFCSWDGGRIFMGSNSHATKEQIQTLQKIYNNELNIPMRFIFTNKLIEEKDCYDRFNNLVLELCCNDMNEIVINSPILEEYLRKNYPNYKFISSTTKCLTDLENAKKEINNPNYILTCIDYNLNKNYSFLESLNPEEKAKTELLVNAICGPGCPNRAQHYTLNSLYALNYGKLYNMKNCAIEHKNLYPTQNKLVINPEEIDDYYYPNGFNNFKLEGRTFPVIEHLLNLVKYMVKSEYQMYVIAQLMDMYNTRKNIL